MAKAKSKKKPLDYSPGTHHWKGAKPNLREFIGFVYEIKNLCTGQMYIGRKLYWEHRKRTKVRQSNWKVYTGSSKRLNKDIEALGIENFSFRILRQYPDKSSLRFGESEMIYKRKALTSYFEDGGRMYYNEQIDRCFSPTHWYLGSKLMSREDYGT